MGPGVTAEGVDAKEGTLSGVIQGNGFDGRDLCNCTGAVSWVNMKGSNYTIIKNSGSNSFKFGYRVYIFKIFEHCYTLPFNHFFIFEKKTQIISEALISAKSGSRNTFTNNTCHNVTSGICISLDSSYNKYSYCNLDPKCLNKLTSNSII